MLYIYKAQATGDRPVADVVVSIDATIPEMRSLEASDALFCQDAELLELALHSALPGGTYDRLLGKMLERKATHFVVSHKS